jgi:hypothetical protein
VLTAIDVNVRLRAVLQAVLFFLSWELW